MDIRLNASIECSDGKRSGKVTGLIIDSEADVLTHLVVKTQGVERLVPAALIRDATPRTIRLDCATTQLHEYPLLIETECIRSTEERYEYLAWGEVFPIYVSETYFVSHQHIPSGEKVLKRGMAVFATDGRIGQVDEVIVDPENDRITQIVLREGHLWGAKEVTVGVEQIRSVDENAIYLKAAKAEVSHWPAHPVQH